MTDLSPGGNHFRDTTDSPRVVFRPSAPGPGIGVQKDFVILRTGEDSNGQLGAIVSSHRFKEQIRDMGDSSSALMNLRPVTFLYRPEYDKGQRTQQYGLIAEEVAEVYPDLVAYDSDGKPCTVKYQYLTSMLLSSASRLGGIRF